MSLTEHGLSKHRAYRGPGQGQGRAKHTPIPDKGAKPVMIHPCDTCVQNRADTKALQRKLAEQTREIAMLENRLVLIDEPWAESTLSALQDVKEVHAKSVELDNLYRKYTLSVTPTHVPKSGSMRWRQEHEDIKNCRENPCQNCEEAYIGHGYWRHKLIPTQF